MARDEHLDAGVGLDPQLSLVRGHRPGLVRGIEHPDKGGAGDIVEALGRGVGDGLGRVDQVGNAADCVPGPLLDQVVQTTWGEGRR